jgi:hypothetical protein
MAIKLIGYYHEHGYNIWTMNAQGDLLEQVCEAGNCRCDSTAMVSIEQGESLATLRRYCEQTGQEMAKEMGLSWGGCEREDDPGECD